MARTAVVAGTATAVSNRVSRRQANRWSAQQEPAPPPQQQYQEPPPPAYAPPPPADDTPDMLDQLQKLGELRAAGVLTEAEFAAQKAKILAG
ncbi:MAG TPA: SHOCT domain-containing protein [Lapillicoccus sp.]|uniref:SHOCT domain-containing protein n=1 Tax=Lapillicoccus sp. TaxID=1909287 RepID=UPI002F946699